MKTLAEIIAEKLNQQPYLADALADDLINTSALARQLQPEIAKEYYKDASEAAIVMALRRFVRTKKHLPAVHFAVRDITVRNALHEYVYENDVALASLQRKLLAKQDELGTQRCFVNITQGIFETTVIVSENLRKLTEASATDLTVRRTHENLAAITLTFIGDSSGDAGVYYPYFKALAWANINFIEVISVADELTFIFEDHHIDAAFRVLNSMV